MKKFLLFFRKICEAYFPNYLASGFAAETNDYLTKPLFFFRGGLL